MKSLTILAIVAVLALGCGNQRIVGEGRDSEGERRSGELNILPDFCRIMELTVPGFQCGQGGSYHPYGVFTRELTIDGELVIDEFEILKGEWSDRELAEVASPSAAIDDGGGGDMICPNPNLTVCKWTWVSNFFEPGFGHWALLCKSYGCLAWETPD